MLYFQGKTIDTIDIDHFRRFFINYNEKISFYCHYKLQAYKEHRSKK